MIQIDTIYAIPELDWTMHSAKEFKQGDRWVIEKESTVMWQVSYAGEPVVVAGLIRPTLVGYPYLWFLLTQEFERRVLTHVRWMTQIVQYLPSETRTLVEQGYDEGVRFAEFFGWEKAGQLAGYDMFRRG